MPLFDVQGLDIVLPTPRGPARAVRGVSFALERGEVLGIVGESGCGKSLTALSLMGLLPEGAQVSGRVRLDGQAIAADDETTWCGIRGNRIGMIFQEPMSALNPVQTIGAQVSEPLRIHKGLSRASALDRSLQLLERVGIPNAVQRLDAYPHQFSGGQRQRIMIAMALACDPDVLIADEPTTALDVTIQKQILDLIAGLVRERGMAMILISHDLGVISQNVDQMLVMYGGSVVESGPTQDVFGRMAHPYTQGLLAARPRLGRARPERLETIPGSVPELVDLPAGCPFAGRCRYAIEVCQHTPPPAIALGAGHWARCGRIDPQGRMPV